MAQMPNGQTYQEDIHYDRDNYLDMEMAYRSVEHIAPRKRARKWFLSAAIAAVVAAAMFWFYSCIPYSSFMEIGIVLVVAAVVCIIVGVRIRSKSRRTTEIMREEQKKR